MKVMYPSENCRVKRRIYSVKDIYFYIWETINQVYMKNVEQILPPLFYRFASNEKFISRFINCEDDHNVKIRKIRITKLN